jgi:uncharacterized protein YuzE
MIIVMPTEEPAPERVPALRLEWDPEAGAGYLALTAMGDGEAVSQRIVENPVQGLDDIVLDFDERGRLLGIEFLDERALPPGLAAPGASEWAAMGLRATLETGTVRARNQGERKATL